MTAPIPMYMAKKADPTRTLTIRNRFVADMRRRFKALAKVVYESVYTNDAFGLEVDHPRTIIQQAATPGQFDFPKSQDKISAFMDWLKEQNKIYIMTGGQRGIRSIFSPGTAGIEAEWANVYIDSAYQAGIRHAREELSKLGIDVPAEDVAGSFNQPFHVDRVGTIYSRVFTDLAGITAAMDTLISRVLAQSMAEGRGPLEIAKALEAVITGAGESLDLIDSLGRFMPGSRRAEILARTEVIRAHHLATIAEYRRAGALGVSVVAEWKTAGDGRVCARCSAMSGKIFSLDIIERMIPLHPQCRCFAKPYFGKKKPLDKRPNI